MMIDRIDARNNIDFVYFSRYLFSPPFKPSFRTLRLTALVLAFIIIIVVFLLLLLFISLAVNNFLIKVQTFETLELKTILFLFLNESGPYLIEKIISMY